MRLVILLLIGAPALHAQPNLPGIVGATEKGINVISWTNQYDGLKSLAVQRSGDSIYNFITIGYVKNLKLGPQAFIDGHPSPGANWYRLYIVFNSDLTWYSNRFKLSVDSVDIANKGVVPPNDSLQRLAGSVKVESTGSDSLQNLVQRLKVSIPSPDEISAYTYIRSKYIFTNPFTGHVNMQLPDPKAHQYSVAFFDQTNKKVLELAKVPQSPLIIDKRNFQRKGVFKFELSKDGKVIEKGFITIY